MKQKERILIVDDDESTCRSLALIFGKKGYEAETTKTAQGALEKAQERFFNAALIDIRLPDMDGTILLDKLKKANPEMVCIIITGHASLQNVITTIKSGTNGYFVKPLNLEDVIYQIEEGLSKQRLKRELKESEERYRNLYENAPDMYISVSPETGRIIRCNEVVIRNTGYTKEEIIGRPVLEMYHPDCLEKAKKTLQQFVTTGEVRDVELQVRRKDGSSLEVSLNVSALRDTAGKIIHSYSSWRDITERKLAEEQLQQSFQSTIRAMNATIETMSKIIEVKDPYTSGHQQRVSHLATAIAKELNLSQDKIEGIRIASLIHDIGKIGLPTEIMSKPSKLSDIEFSLIKEHPQIGHDILKSIDFSYPVANIVLQHHERLNGSGYPNKLKGDDILLEAKIIGVADVVEAMSSHRPYRPALGLDKALEEITQNRGKLYDPQVADACVKLFKEKGFKLE